MGSKEVSPIEMKEFETFFKHKLWIKENAETLWNFSRYYYLSLGKGAITISEPLANDRKTYETEKDLDYIDNERFDSFIGEYDPNSSFIVVVLDKDADSRVYKVRVRK